MIKNIVLDFGHGGMDPEGNYTTAPDKMFEFPNGEIAYEGVLNRQIGGKLYHYLSLHNEFNTLCTVYPHDYEDMSLSNRVEIANQFDPQETIFISIHCNASPENNAKGFEIFTTKGVTQSDALAERIAKEMEYWLPEAGSKLRYDLSDGDKDKEADFYVLKYTKCPAVLAECGFFDYWEEFERLRNPDFQDKMAYSIYLGILNHNQGSLSRKRICRCYCG